MSPDYVKLETHMHTSEVSGCGRSTAAEMVRALAAKGYAAAFVTDHYDPAFLERTAGLTQPERIRRLLAGFFAAAEEGARQGVTVLPAFELRVPGGDEDFLVYGLSESDMAALGPLPSMDLPTAFALVCEAGGLLLQAHPFRRRMRRQPSRYLHGCETFNAHPDHEARNDLALCWALQQRPGFIRLAGSDAHHVLAAGRSGLCVPRAALSPAAFADYLRHHPAPEQIMPC